MLKHIRSNICKCYLPQVYYKTLWSSSRWVFAVFKIFYGRTIHLKSIRCTIFNTSTRQTALNQKTRHLSCRAGVHRGLSHTIKESDSWFLFLDWPGFRAWWLKKRKPGGNKLSRSSTAAISCGQILEMIRLLPTLGGIISQVYFLQHTLQPQDQKWSTD